MFTNTTTKRNFRDAIFMAIITVPVVIYWRLVQAVAYLTARTQTRIADAGSRVNGNTVVSLGYLSLAIIALGTAITALAYCTHLGPQTVFVF